MNDYADHLRRERRRHRANLALGCVLVGIAGVIAAVVLWLIVAAIAILFG